MFTVLGIGTQKIKGDHYSAHHTYQQKRKQFTRKVQTAHESMKRWLLFPIIKKIKVKTGMRSQCSLARWQV